MIKKQYQIKIIKQFCLTTTKHVKTEYINNATIHTHFTTITLATILHMIKIMLNNTHSELITLDNHYLTVCYLWDLENDDLYNQPSSTIQQIYNICVENSLTLFGLNALIDKSLQKKNKYSLI